MLLNQETDEYMLGLSIRSFECLKYIVARKKIRLINFHWNMFYSHLVDPANEKKNNPLLRIDTQFFRLLFFFF